MTEIIAGARRGGEFWSFDGRLIVHLFVVVVHYFAVINAANRHFTRHSDDKLQQQSQALTILTYTLIRIPC